MPAAQAAWILIDQQSSTECLPYRLPVIGRELGSRDRTFVVRRQRRSVEDRIVRALVNERDRAFLRVEPAKAERQPCKQARNDRLIPNRELPYCRMLPVKVDKIAKVRLKRQFAFASAVAYEFRAPSDSC